VVAEVGTEAVEAGVPEPSVPLYPLGDLGDSDLAARLAEAMRMQVPRGPRPGEAGTTPRMLPRMHKERITISLSPGVAERVRQCGAKNRGGVSGYLERLVRQDELREGVDAMARWYDRHPGYAEDAEDERIAAADELGETA
jgi:hypothetical protein